MYRFDRAGARVRGRVPGEEGASGVAREGLLVAGAGPAGLRR